MNLFTDEQNKLLDELNSIIQLANDSHMWMGLSTYDLRLREYFNNINETRLIL